MGVTLELSSLFLHQSFPFRRFCSQLGLQITVGLGDVIFEYLDHRRGIFQPVARHLPRHAAEDRLQDAVGQTWELTLRFAEDGKAIDDAIRVVARR